ncbi:MAG: phospholipase D-like domain-containing protein, partial [Longimicrobiales bacterium]
SRAGYRPLLEAGVRVFEWKGSMMHAKTAVADGLWARVGSSNLNLQSWLGNYELDVVVEDEHIAADMEQMYLDDLENTTEFVLGRPRVLREPGFKRSVDRPRLRRYGVRARARGSASRLTAGALRVGSTVSAAMADRRIFTPNEARILAPAGFVMLAIAAVAFLWPRLLTIPLAALLAWVGTTLLVRAFSLRRARRKTKPLPATSPTSDRTHQADAEKS